MYDNVLQDSLVQFIHVFTKLSLLNTCHRTVIWSGGPCTLDFYNYNLCIIKYWPEPCSRQPADYEVIRIPAKLAAVPVLRGNGRGQQTFLSFIILFTHVPTIYLYSTFVKSVGSETAIAVFGIFVVDTN